MKLYKIYLPKFFNTKEKVPEEKIFSVTSEIEQKFGAYSIDPFGRLPIIQGVWASSEKMRYSEEMYVIELFAEDTFEIRKWFKSQVKSWRNLLEQEELFIIVQDAEIMRE